jgi:hypothetical protein
MISPSCGGDSSPAQISFAIKMNGSCIIAFLACHILFFLLPDVACCKAPEISPDIRLSAAVPV